jgi:dTDP-4-amino-4,6-dideoxygalactose transaminase
MFLKRPIFISLSPNVEKDDIWLALKLIFCPWKWKKGKATRELEEKFSNYLGVRHAFALNGGRSAFSAILSALGLEKSDEVLLQAFTCNAAVNPIIWSGLKPIFVDIEKETLNINPQDLEGKITSKSRAVLVQHTFGMPAKINEILEICKKHNLILIEDCAHSLGADYNGQKVGSFGKASFFSLGRDKIISSIYGGIAVTNDKALASRIKDFQEKCSMSSGCWILQQLLHPVLTKIMIMPLYGLFGIGKYFLVAFQRLKIISKAVHRKEKQGEQPKYLPQKMPNALALLGLNQFKKLERFSRHRVEITKTYNPNTEKRVYMRYPIFLDNSDKMLKKFKEKGIYLDDGWRKSAIVPQGTDQRKMGYEKGSCPIAEGVVRKIINFPTHINISVKRAQELKNLLKKFQEK